MPRHDQHQQLQGICDRIAEGRHLARQLTVEVRKHGLTETEFRLLWLLRSQQHNCAKPHAAQTELVKQLGVSAAQVSSLVEGLRQKQVIQPIAVAQDRRLQSWELTNEGRQTFEEFVARVSAACQGWHEIGLSEIDRVAPLEDAA